MTKRAGHRAMLIFPDGWGGNRPEQSDSLDVPKVFDYPAMWDYPHTGDDAYATCYRDVNIVA